MKSLPIEAFTVLQNVCVHSSKLLFEMTELKFTFPKRHVKVNNDIGMVGFLHSTHCLSCSAFVNLKFNSLCSCPCLGVLRGTAMQKTHFNAQRAMLNQFTLAKHSIKTQHWEGSVMS